MSMTWTQGRRLSTLTKNGVTSTYTYNVNGIRTGRTYNTREYEMILSDDTLIGVTCVGSYTLIFIRDDTDRIIGFKHYGPTGTYYGTRYYEFNAQGDVVALYDGHGALLGTYAYDSWGKLLAVTDPDGNTITSHANPVVANPIRYRGYYYDTETGFYYLNSRYYDPVTRRFINADSYASTGQGFVGFNMFAYCLNNPVRYADSTGHSAYDASEDTAIKQYGNDLDALEDAVEFNAAMEDVEEQLEAGQTVDEIRSQISNKYSKRTLSAIDGYYKWKNNFSTSSFSTPKVTSTTALQSYYPPNDGFVKGTQRIITLSPKTLIQRTGRLSGTYVAPMGTPAYKLSLPFNQIGQPTTYYQVNSSIRVVAGSVAPWFNQLGGGIQYKLLDGSVQDLESGGFISKFGG